MPVAAPRFAPNAPVADFHAESSNAVVVHALVRGGSSRVRAVVEVAPGRAGRREQGLVGGGRRGRGRGDERRADERDGERRRRRARERAGRPGGVRVHGFLRRSGVRAATTVGPPWRRRTRGGKRCHRRQRGWRPCVVGMNARRRPDGRPPPGPADAGRRAPEGTRRRGLRRGEGGSGAPAPPEDEDARAERDEQERGDRDTGGLHAGRRETTRATVGRCSRRVGRARHVGRRGHGRFRGHGRGRRSRRSRRGRGLERPVGGVGERHGDVLGRSDLEPHRPVVARLDRAAVDLPGRLAPSTPSTAGSRAPRARPPPRREGRRASPSRPPGPSARRPPRRRRTRR